MPTLVSGYNSSMRLRILAMVLVVIALVAFLDIYFGINKGYFWTLWWWDVMEHMLGGVALGLAGAWAMMGIGKQPTFVACVAAALAVGIVWEIFEYMVFGTGAAVFMSYPLDTLKDIIDDCIGGVIAGLFVTRGLRP